MSKSYSKTRVLVECALMVAIGTVLANIKIFTMPNGGSVTLLSMLPFVLVSFRHGVKWGLFTGLVNGCLQMLLGFWAPPTPTFIYFLGEILLPTRKQHKTKGKTNDETYLYPDYLYCSGHQSTGCPLLCR